MQPWYTDLYFLPKEYSKPKGENEMELITNARRAAHNNAEKERNDKHEAVYEHSKAAIALQKAEEECPSIKWRTLFYPGLLTEEEQTRIEQINEEYKVLRAKIDATYIELECLYNIADTFEQKQSLLQQYNVLQYGGNVWPNY